MTLDFSCCSLGVMRWCSGRSNDIRSRCLECLMLTCALLFPRCILASPQGDTVVTKSEHSQRRGDGPDFAFRIIRRDRCLPCIERLVGDSFVGVSSNRALEASRDVYGKANPAEVCLAFKQEFHTQITIRDQVPVAVVSKG